MPTDPYEVLGVTKDTSQADIQKAYRRLAKNFIPTSIPKAEEKFKDVTAAYDLLNEPEKRARFDRGEIDGFGAERPQRRYYRAHNGARTHAYSSGSVIGYQVREQTTTRSIPTVDGVSRNCRVGF